jgi:hypothetical protein
MSTRFFPVCDASNCIVSQLIQPANFLADWDPDKSPDSNPIPFLDLGRFKRLKKELKEALNQINQLRGEIILERDKALEQTGRSINCSPNDSESNHEQKLRNLFATCFPGSKFSPLERQCSSECVPLNECILAIAWDSTTPSLECLATLLPRAAAYQAEHQEVVSPY